MAGVQRKHETAHVYGEFVVSKHQQQDQALNMAHKADSEGSSRHTCS